MQAPEAKTRNKFITSVTSNGLSCNCLHATKSLVGSSTASMPNHGVDHGVACLSLDAFKLLP